MKVKKPEMKKRFDKELVMKKGGTAECMAKIKLKNNRCAFLNQQNLCDIYKELGENYLSETCTMYPRNTNELGKRVELSLALSCPEAARQILLSEEKISFSIEEVNPLPIVGARLNLQLEHPKHFEDYLLPMRMLLIDILQETAYGVKDKWLCIEYVMTQFDEAYKRQDLKKLTRFLDEMKTSDAIRKKIELLAGQKMPKMRLNAYTSMEMGKKLLNELQLMRANKKWPSARYEACYDSMLAGLGEKLEIKQYQKGESIYEKVMTYELPHILENYFVSYIYERLVPINQKTPLESLEEMYLYLALIRLHLIGIAAKDGALTTESIITCIQSFTRVFDHNELYMQQLKKLTK